MKYMGSKARFAEEILSVVLENRGLEQWYVEPFAGGMNTICNVRGNRIANDIHGPLIEMWKALLGGWDPKIITKEEYEMVRINRELYPAYFTGWVGFNCSYSGKWFGGFAGEVKTKTGGIRNYQAEAINNVKKQVEKCDGVVLQNKSYDTLEIPPNSIVYCDPPYAKTTRYSNDFDHILFWNWVRTTSEQGHTVFVSEYAAPDGFSCVWEKKATSSLSANGKSGGNKISTEKLFKCDRTFGTA